MIIVPSNLFEQWINEISKFVWDGRPLRRLRKRPGSGHVDQSDAGGAQATNEKWLVSTRVPAQDLCYVERLPTVSLQGSAEASVSRKGRLNLIAQASEVSSADVVICSYRLLYSQIYLKRREAEPEHGPKKAGSHCTAHSASAQELCGSLWKLPGQVRGLLQGTTQRSSEERAHVLLLQAVFLCGAAGKAMRWSGSGRTWRHAAAKTAQNHTPHQVGLFLLEVSRSRDVLLEADHLR